MIERKRRCVTMTMYVIKKDIPDSDKYYYKEFKRLYGYESDYSLKLTLMLLKQYYECAIIREKTRKCYR